ncbi:MULTISPECIES: hypothetical protein [Cyanophyceae]|uniref:hypothetical protein n=1 Tax=Cyanophyceae TaxID=3028117 RepID=UPI0016882107|nr:MULTISPECIES: hypothetical protein [Cyanophyceae]MBD1915063.1 hypothetical protein [Phormidium sp. FACHB-77]MBD2030809.1 hypothetical protein [Phormidium sp. FACHB-322]MBD2053163.1 hypothetical protein [Leptolyngbya sp. FACHB-60]
MTITKVVSDCAEYFSNHFADGGRGFFTAMMGQISLISGIVMVVKSLRSHLSRAFCSTSPSVFPTPEKAVVFCLTSGGAAGSHFFLCHFVHR